MAFQFIKHKNALENNIQSQGGVDVIYSEFVDFFTQKGFRTRELTSSSVYLHYGTQVGKIGVQLVVLSNDRAKVKMSEELRTGQQHSISADVEQHENQFMVAHRLLQQLPHHDQILDSVSAIPSPKRKADIVKYVDNDDFPIRDTYNQNGRLVERYRPKGSFLLPNPEKLDYQYDGEKLLSIKTSSTDQWGDFAYVGRKYDYDHKGNLISISEYQASGERIRLEVFEIVGDGDEFDRVTHLVYEWQGSRLVVNPDDPGRLVIIETVSEQEYTDRIGSEFAFTYKNSS